MAKKGNALLDSVTGAVPIAQGGTAATTASDAVDSLGGAPSTGSDGLVRKTSPTLVTPVLGVASGTSLTLSGQPRCSIYRTAVQSINNTTFTAVDFPTGSATEAFDVGNMHSLSSNSTRITIPSDGLYLFGGAIEFGANAVGIRELVLKLDGTTYLTQSVPTSVSVASSTCVVVSGLFNLTAAQYLELFVYQSSGGALNVAGTDISSSNFWAVKLM